jgi:UDP-2-acetamido-2,6-beta-L-arabino-hexul-4-ose reductase
MQQSPNTTLNVLITGANGFIGKNLQLHLAERQDARVVCFTHEHTVAQLPALLRGIDFVFHLAGVNRPKDPQEFILGNVSLTQALCDAVANEAIASKKNIPIIYASSMQVNSDNLYGQSKRAAESVLLSLKHDYDNPVHIFRLPNVFGKFCKPNYNSVVATFCHNIAHGLPIRIDDPVVSMYLVYVDDVIGSFLQLMDGVDHALDADGFVIVSPQYTCKVGELAHLIQSFKDSRTTLMTERVGAGLVRALYSTYVSYLPTESFAYSIPRYTDQRGVFVEMLKTPDCGQFSYFTSGPGVIRGSHYHHTKTEKFLVIKGEARFRFRHMNTGEVFELVTRGEKAEIVETVPGWTHDITNIGDDEMLVMLWANEVFDRANPDTYNCQL